MPWKHRYFIDWDQTTLRLCYSYALIYTLKEHNWCIKTPTYLSRKRTDEVKTFDLRVTRSDFRYRKLPLFDLDTENILNTRKRGWVNEGKGTWSACEPTMKTGARGACTWIELNQKSRPACSSPRRMFHSNKYTARFDKKNYNNKLWSCCNS